MSRFEAWKESINHSLYGSKKSVLLIIKVISILNAFIAVDLIIFDIGFSHTPEKMHLIHAAMDTIFLIYALMYMLKVMYSFKRREYVKSTMMEFVMVCLVIVISISRYVFDFHPLETVYTENDPEGFLEFYDTIITFLMLYFVGFEFIKASSVINSVTVKPAATFIFSFIILIAIGAFLLMLPEMSTVEGSGGFMNGIFTSVSASCVTGLSLVDIGQYYTLKGHIIIMVLMQFGGIGIVVFATFFATFLKRGVGLRHQLVIQDFLASESLFSAKGLLRQVIFITLLIEFLVAIAIFFAWGNDIHFDSLGQKIFYSLFHAISAFCNAGFSLFSNGLYDTHLQYSYLLHVIIAVTIIMGGMGFSVIQDIFSIRNLRMRLKHPWKDWKLSSRIAVYSALVLIAVGMFGFYFLEKDNTLGGLSTLESMVGSFFQSVTTRTAGFNTVDISQLATPTLVLMVFLMFIGASSGSTAGGIKTSTFVIILNSSVTAIRGKKTVTMGKKSISQDLIYKAFSIFFFAVAFNTVMILILSISESHLLTPDPATGIPKFSMVNIVFEQISAFGTVGLSTGLTPEMSVLGKSILMLSMFLGRVGTLTLALALASRRSSNNYEYPNAHLMVG